MGSVRFLSAALGVVFGFMPASVNADVSGITATRAVELERLVVQDCGSCHGLTMKGGLGRAITPQDLEHFDRPMLSEIILDGIPGTAMPPWRPLLTEDEAAWIADYLKTGEN